MTSSAFFLRVIRRVPVLASFAKSIIRKKVAGNTGRKGLNKWYGMLDLDAKAVFQNIFSKIFREKGMEITNGYWSVFFCGKEIKMPLRNEQSWLDWDNAVSIIGHDPDVKQTYENLLCGKPGIRTFFDIGANYGTHSLLFLCNGVHTVSFEPNYSLNENFQLLCRENNVEGRMENYALSDTTGQVNLHFPADATWLGTILDSETTALGESHKMETIEVPMITLDEYAFNNNQFPDLIKIDTEGNEINVLKGATELIKTRRPLIIFESNSGKKRDPIWNYFSNAGYHVCDLPYAKDDRKQIHSAESFIARKEYNFIAVPAGGE
jgi:FkbM family methyltransferase